IKILIREIIMQTPEEFRTVVTCKGTIILVNNPVIVNIFIFDITNRLCFIMRRIIKFLLSFKYAVLNKEEIATNRFTNFRYRNIRNYRAAINWSARWP